MSHPSACTVGTRQNRKLVSGYEVIVVSRIISGKAGRSCTWNMHLVTQVQHILVRHCVVLLTQYFWYATWNPRVLCTFLEKHYHIPEAISRGRGESSFKPPGNVKILLRGLLYKNQRKWFLVLACHFVYYLGHKINTAWKIKVTERDTTCRFDSTVMHSLKNSANWSAASVIERYVNCERSAFDKHRILQHTRRML